ncbi:Lcat [Symbiodinium sp. CCMP2592]|nr:Lcat [Symbiodinium sp. CCMP2592]
MKILWLWLVARGIAREDGAGNRPLILVPGLTGSALEVQERDAPMPHFWCKRSTSNEWMQIWVSPVQTLPWEIDCLMARMSLTYDAATDVYSNLAGVELRARGWGNGTANGKTHKDILYSYQFDTMLHHLQQNLGYELGTDVFLAPYDWRLAGDAHSKPANGVGGYYRQLQGLIERTVQAADLLAIMVNGSCHVLQHVSCLNWKCTCCLSCTKFALGRFVSICKRSTAFAVVRSMANCVFMSVRGCLLMGVVCFVVTRTLQTTTKLSRFHVECFRYTVVS